LCSAQDQRRRGDGRRSHGHHLRHRSPVAPHDPHPCCELGHLHIILIYAPFLRNQKLVLEINLAPKRCNKLVLVLLLLRKR
jgi:hypothetical protein